MEREPELDVIVVGAGFAGLYALHRLRGMGLSVRVLRGRRRRRRHVVLEPLPGRALRRREPRLLVLVLAPSSSRSGTGPSATRPSPRSCATSSTSPTASTCDATSSSTRGSTAAVFDEDDRALGASRPTRGDSSPRAPDHGDRLPVGGQAPGLPGPRRASPGESYHTGRWPHEGVDFTRQARRRHRHRLVGHPGDPGHRRAGRRSSPCSSARRTTASRRATARSIRTERAEVEGRLRRAAPADAREIGDGHADARRNDDGARRSPPRSAGRVRGALAARRLRASSAPSPTCSPIRRPTSTPPSSSAPRSARSSTTRRSPRS